MPSAPFETDGDGENPFEIQHDLQNMMQERAGIVRTEENLSFALDALVGLRERASRASAYDNRDYNPGWHTALDLDNLLDVSEMIVRSAIERRESRGGHFHDDYPQKCEQHGTWNTVITMTGDGSMQRAEQQIPAIREDLQSIIEENQK